MELNLRERGGPVAVTPGDWQRLRLDETIGMLARQGVVRIERSSGAILIFPSNYVGEMRGPNVTLTVRPKNEALHNAILSLALRFEGRVAHHYDAKPSAGSGDDLATPFLSALARCLEEGLPWDYEHRTEATSRPRGKPHFAETIAKFVSRGVMHKVVASRHERHQTKSFTNVVWAAYQHLPGASGATPSLIQTAAILIKALDTADNRTLSEVIVEAEELLVSDELQSSSARKLIVASLALLKNDKLLGNDIITLPGAVARFTNLERVWEHAVASLVAETVLTQDTTVALHGLEGSRIRLFGTSGPMIDPDVIVHSTNGEVRFIADAKYKVLARKETGGLASDIYQITCYVDRTKAGFGMLVYLGLDDSFTILGVSQTGGQISTVGLSAESLVLYGHQSLARLLPQGSPLVENV